MIPASMTDPCREFSQLSEQSTLVKFRMIQRELCFFAAGVHTVDYRYFVKSRLAPKQLTLVPFSGRPFEPLPQKCGGPERSVVRRVVGLGAAPLHPRRPHPRSQVADRSPCRTAGRANASSQTDFHRQSGGNVSTVRVEEKFPHHQTGKRLHSQSEGNASASSDRANFER